MQFHLYSFIWCSKLSHESRQLSSTDGGRDLFCVRIAPFSHILPFLFHILLLATTICASVVLAYPQQAWAVAAAAAIRAPIHKYIHIKRIIRFERVPR